MDPVSSLIPTIPPTLVWASMVPAKVQDRICPLLLPATPPIFFLLPVGVRVPSICKSLTVALSCTYRKNPSLDPSPSKVKPEIVCPPPSKVPPKVGSDVKSEPVRSRSAVRVTVFPWDQVSSLQFFASSSSSSTLATVIFSPSAYTTGTP